MATAWSAWSPDVLLHVSGAPDPLVSQEINRAARDFFTRTHAWYVWLDGQIVIANETAEYQFALPSNSEVVRLERAAIGNRPVDVLNWRTITTPDDVTETGVLSSDRLAFTLPNLEGTAGESVRVRVSLRPTLTAPSLESDAMAAEYREVIAAGALSRLLSMPTVPWQNQAAAGMYAGEYEALLGKAVTRIFRGHTASTPRLAPEWV